jgi:hypothetical protein
VTLFQLVKGDFPQGNIAYTFRSWQWKDNGILFKKNGKLFLSIKAKILIFKFHEDFPSPSF